MTAELERDSLGRTRLVIIPNSSTEAIALRDHMRQLGIVEIDEQGYQSHYVILSMSEAQIRAKEKANDQ